MAVEIAPGRDYGGHGARGITPGAPGATSAAMGARGITPGGRATTTNLTDSILVHGGRSTQRIGIVRSTTVPRGTETSASPRPAKSSGRPPRIEIVPLSSVVTSVRT